MSNNSLIFTSTSSQSLTATGKTNINQQKFTFAFWIKTTTVTGPFLFYLGDGTNVNELFLALSAAGAVQLGGRTASSIVVNLITTAKVNDGNWHSVVIAMDTTQATASNRGIIYIDGSVAGLATNTQPSQNANLSNNFAATYRIGANQVPGGFFNGNLAQVYYIDGQQLTPSSFTIGSPLTPITFTGSYTGVFDFFLPFSNAVSLGADNSGEGNNWTLQNGPTQSTDYPFVPPVSTGVDAGSSISGGTFSRGRWHALLATIEAEREAERKARQAKESKRKRRLAWQAAEILREAKEHAEKAAESDRIDAAIAEMAERAKSATLTADLVKELRGHVDRIAALHREMEDEDEATALLLALH